MYEIIYIYETVIGQFYFLSVKGIDSKDEDGGGTEGRNKTIP